MATNLVPFDLDPQGGIAEPDTIPDCRTKHLDVRCPRDRVLKLEGSFWLRDMAEAFLDECLHDVVCSRGVIRTGSEAVTTTDDLGTRYGNKGDGPGRVWFETDGGAGGDVETFSVGLGPVKVEGRIGFDEVVVRTDLD